MVKNVVPNFYPNMPLTCTFSRNGSRLLHPISRLSTITVMFDIKRCSLMLFPVLPKLEVVFDGQMVSRSTVYFIEVE